jgi:hypothetical protein
VDQEEIAKHFAMTGSNPSGYCVYENHHLCHGGIYENENEHGEGCTCICHKAQQQSEVEKSQDWQEPDFSISEESKTAWKILKHHTEVASDRIYEELPSIIRNAFGEGVAYAREQIAREIEAEGPWCSNPHHREKGNKSANDCPCYIFAAAIARGEK